MAVGVRFHFRLRIGIVIQPLCDPQSLCTNVEQNDSPVLECPLLNHPGECPDVAADISSAHVGPAFDEDNPEPPVAVQDVGHQLPVAGFEDLEGEDAPGE